MRAVIICGGLVSDYDYIKSLVKKDDTVICADSGYEHALKMGVLVDAVVGDFDSLGSIPQGVNTVRFPARKNHTDSEIALEYARSKGFSEFLFLGALGGRMDHTLTNVLMLKQTLSRHENAMIADEKNRIIITSSSAEITEPEGSVVSLIPIEDCKGVTTSGLEYPLLEADLLVGKGLGVSNVMLTDKAGVSLKSGVLLVVLAKD